MFFEKLKINVCSAEITTPTSAMRVLQWVIGEGHHKMIWAYKQEISSKSQSQYVCMLQSFMDFGTLFHHCTRFPVSLSPGGTEEVGLPAVLV